MRNCNVHAQLTYLANSVESSLYRNGKVFTHRDRNGNDGAYHGVVMEQRDAVINNGRRIDQSKNRQLEVHGFELFHRPLHNSDLQFYDQLQVVKEYYSECAEIVMEATNATQVLAFDHNIRWAKGKNSKKRIKDGQQVQSPIYFVHGDYTLASAPQRLRDLTRPSSINDTLRSVLGEGESLLTTDVVSQNPDDGKRFAIINVWRNIDRWPVMSDPLALCDGQSVSHDDLVVFEVHYDDRIGENYFAKYSPSHEWWYYPLMTRDEVILIKQWDSMGRLAQTGGVHADSSVGNGDVPCTFSFHSAFSEPNTQTDAPERHSIEVRCVVFFD